MVTGPLSEAHVEIDADVDKADKALDGLDLRLEGIEDLAEQVGEAVEEAFREAFRAIVRDVDIATSSIESEFNETQREVDGILRDIGGPELFAAVEGQAEAAGEAIEGSFAEARRGVDEDLGDIGGANAFAPVVAQAEVAGEAVERAFRDSANDSTRALARIGTGGAGLSLVTTGLGAVAVGFGLAGAAATAFGVTGAASLEQTQIGFEALLGSAEEADAFIREMQEFAASTPFEFQGLADNARRLLAVGEAAGIARDEIIPTITTIGDLTAVLAAPPEAIDSVVRALGQMASRGKITSEEMLQLAEALPGFAPFQAMADGLGLTTAELQEQITKGTIPAKEGIDALLEGMAEFPGAAGAMAKQAETLTGLFSTFTDTIQLTLTDAFQPLVPTLKDVLAEATTVIGDSLGLLAPPLALVAGGLVTTLLDVFGGLAPGLAVIVQGIGESLEALGPTFTFLSQVASFAFAPLAEILPTVARLLQPILVLFGQLATTVLPPLLTLFGTLLTVITPVVDVLAAGLGDAIEDLAPLFVTLSEALTEIAETAAPILQSLAEIFVDLLDSLSPMLPVLTEVVEILGQGLTDALEILGPALEDVAVAFGDALLEALDAIGPDLPEFARSLASIAVSLAEILAALTPLLVPLLQLGTIFLQIQVFTQGLVTQGLALLLGFLADIATFIRENFRPALDAIADGAVSLWQDVLVPFSEFLSTLFLAAVQGVADLFVNWVVPAVQGVIDAATWLWQNVLVPVSEFIAAVLQPVLIGLAAIMFGPLAAAVTAVSIGLNALWNFVLVPLGGFIAGTFGPIVTTLASVLGTVLVGAFNLAMAAAGALWNGVLVPLGGFLAAGFTGAVNLAKAAFDLLSGAVGAVSGAITGAISAAFDPLKSLLETGFNAAIGLVSEAFGLMSGAVDIVSDAIETLIGWVETAIDKVQDLIDKIESIPGAGVVGQIVGAIPGFAGGGLITEPTIIAAGEKSRRELILPLTDPARTVELARQHGLYDVLSRGGEFRASTPSTTTNPAGDNGGGTVINLTLNAAPGMTTGEAAALARAGANAAADVLDKRAARMEAKIA